MPFGQWVLSLFFLGGSCLPGTRLSFVCQDARCWEGDGLDRGTGYFLGGQRVVLQVFEAERLAEKCSPRAKEALRRLCCHLEAHILV